MSEIKVFLTIVVNVLILYEVYKSMDYSSVKQILVELFVWPVITIGNCGISQRYVCLLEPSKEIKIIEKMINSQKSCKVNRFIRHTIENLTCGSLFKIAISDNQYRRVAYLEIVKRRKISHTKLKSLFLDLYWKESLDALWIERLDFEV